MKAKTTTLLLLLAWTLPAVPAVAQEPLYGGWVIRTPDAAAAAPAAPRAVVVERGVAMIKHAMPTPRPGRAGLLLECRKGSLALLAIDLDIPPGVSPVGDVDVKIKVDQDELESERWSILGNAYEPPNPRRLVTRFLAARSFALLVPTPLGEREMTFDLQGFSTAAEELRKTCPF